MKALNYFIPSPDLIFYLNSNAATLYARKKELNVAQLVGQQDRYHKMLFNFDNAVYIDTSGTPQQSRDRIIKSCISYMSDRVGN